MNEKQIAEEAHRELQDTKQLGGENYQPVVTTAIIQRYVEKAIALHNYELICTAARRTNESRAARESEPWKWTTYRNKVCSDVVIGEAKTNADAEKIVAAHNSLRAAHASENGHQAATSTFSSGTEINPS